MFGSVSIAPLSDVIREATSADIEAYRAILDRSSRQDIYYRFLHAVNVVSDKELSGYLGGPDTFAYVAEEGGQAIGIIHATVEGSRAELAIIVVPQSRKHGVGHGLLDRLVAELKAKGVRELVAYSLTENEQFATLVMHSGMRRIETDLGVDLWHREL
jgi:N-acetylglutamate synthase-like GNAT family acetyltransferase